MTGNGGSFLRASGSPARLSSMDRLFIYITHFTGECVCVCMDYVNVLSAGVSAQDVDG